MATDTLHPEVFAPYVRPGGRGQPQPARLGLETAIDPPVLSIVIPALNEEDSIASTVQRCLAARERIVRVGGIRDLEVTVVSDGSTDRTAEIARGLADVHANVRVIVFEQNKGYGAAIKEGFRQSSGALVAFLDADGTCDPNYFGELCQAVREQGAAIALGSRMGRGSEMPRIRRLGNRFYAFLLGTLSGRAVTDTASGMRVLRRDCLADLYPLPDGLHFTPAMSARAVMSDMRIVEVPMAYAERVGESKLRVMRDGVRFLLAIRDAAMLYRPGRIFGLAAVACAVAATALGVYPVEFYLANGRLEEWMSFRLLLCGFLFTGGFTLLSAGVLADRVLSLVYRRRDESFVSGLFDRLLNRRRLVVISAAFALLALTLLWPVVRDYVQSGALQMHWTRAASIVFLLQLSVVAAANAVLQKTIDLWREQLQERSGPAPVRR